MDQIFIQVINWIGCMPNELIAFIEFVLCAFFLLLLFRLYSYYGVYAFNVVATIMGNIQVLREVEYFFQAERVALGSIVFAMSFTGSDIITEHFGKKVAQSGVMLTFITQVFFTLVMLLLITYTPYDDHYYNHLKAVFITSPRFLVASLIAYLISQILDIHIFSWLKNYFSGLRWLWFRSGVSIVIASLVDNIIFSVIAWKILGTESISMSKLIFTYILGTYWFKLLINFSTSFLIYLSYQGLKYQKN